MPGWINAHVHLNWHFDNDHKLVNRGETPQAALCTLPKTPG